LHNNLKIKKKLVLLTNITKKKNLYLPLAIYEKTMRSLGINEGKKFIISI